MSVWLRKFKDEDAHGVFLSMSDIQMHRFLMDQIPFPYSFERAQRFARQAAEDFPLCCAIEKDGEFVGCISLMEKSDVYAINMEIGYWISPNYWKQGIASEAIRQILNVAFSRSEILRVYANVFAQNIASVKALERAGFSREGFYANSLVKHGVVYDCAVMGISKEKWKKIKGGE